MDSVIIFCAEYLLFIVAGAAFIYWLTLSRKQKLHSFIFGVITGIIAFAFSRIGSSLLSNPRPFVTDHVQPLFAHIADNGFPSDHTLLASIIAITIWSVSKKWGYALFAIAVIIGGSRVLAHVHHLIDILGSLVFVVTAGAIAYYITPKLMTFVTAKRKATK